MFLAAVVISLTDAYGITVDEARKNRVEACKYDPKMFKKLVEGIDKAIEEHSKVGDTEIQFGIDDGELANCQLADMRYALTKYYLSKGFKVTKAGEEWFSHIEISWE